MPPRHPWTIAILTLLVAAGAYGEARACAVPVFRYALERWRPSPYQVQIFHRDELSDAELALVKQLEGKGANLKVTTIDLDGELTSAQHTLWKLRGKESSLPWVIAQYP